jgi:7,8-dihydro-6-hydroxymethylpterin dimethyltransferase
MTFPVELPLFGFQISAHQILELVAYAAGFQLYLFLRRRWNEGPPLTVEQTAIIFLGVIFGALFGARALDWAESYPFYWEHRFDPAILLGGKTIVGALMGGWIGASLAKRRLGLQDRTGNVYVFPVILGMCIGRVGCFLAGLTDHTYGIATTLPWGVDFGDGIRRHPTQLYEIAFLIFIAGFFVWRLRTGRQSGCMFAQFLAAYLVFRFGVDFLKPRVLLPLIPLSAIQTAALAGMVYAVAFRKKSCCGAAVGESALSVGPEHCGTSDSGSPVLTELTLSLCSQCLKTVEAKVLIDGDSVYLQKFCQSHGLERILISDDVEYWRKSRKLYKPPTQPLRRNTQRKHGCPNDCGICPDHEQHTCLAIIEITGDCDLHCPVCYAGATHGGRHRSLAEIEAMLDSAVANEGELSVVQISGGEPALHPELFSILDMVKTRPVRHLMLNTNGLRIAGDPVFAARLASYMPGFEIYLQFDSLRPETLRRLRGSDLSSVRRRAVEALNRLNVSTTLVVTVAKGVNDGEIGEILDFAVNQPCVRGVTFQPIQLAGRLEGIDPALQRLPLSAVRREILKQSPIFTPKDIVPVPCHPDSLGMAYAVRRKGKLVPLSRFVDPERLFDLGGNTICYEQDAGVRKAAERLFSAGASPLVTQQILSMFCCLPVLSFGRKPIQYEDVFRIILMDFMDAGSMDLRSLKRSCVHIVQPDGRLVPFETCNLLYREPLDAKTKTG